MFFTFDGIDGAGKSTQMQLFCQWLRDAGRDVVSCRDPGSTALGDSIRELLLGSHKTRISCMAEMLLYMAARAQLVEEVIRPALAVDKTVVSDRYLLSNVVYQGYAGGLDIEILWQIGRHITGGLEPNLTFVLDMPPEAAASRIRRELDRMEQRGSDYRERLRRGFLIEARRQSDRIVVIDASGSIDAVQDQIRAAAQRLIQS